MKRLGFNKKTVILSGATSGIGLSMARELILKHGCVVYAIARGKERLERIKNELGEKYIPYPMDVSDEKSWIDLAQNLEKSDTSPDILINCAGILPEFASFDNTECQTVENVMKINFLSCVYACKHIKPLIGDGGAIANISSSSALCPFGGVCAYTASKAALERFTESVSAETKNIRISCVMPGFVKTQIMKGQQITEKEKGIIDLFSQRPEKCAKKILRRISRRKRRIVVGIDARFMSFMYRFFPRISPRLFTWVIKKTGFKLFERI